MTDKEALEKMLTEAGIEYTWERAGLSTGLAGILRVERGYSGFFTYFEFNNLGALTDMGAEE